MLCVSAKQPYIPPRRYLIKIYYLLILFRERGRKPPVAPGWLAALDARFDVAALEIQPNVATAAVAL
jgi:hypothetical protein